MRGDLCEKRKGDGEGSMKDLTHEMKQSLLAPFEAAEIRIKVQPFIAAYVSARVVMTRLDEVLPFQWDFESVDWNMSGSVLNVKGCLRIFQPDFPPLCYFDWGSGPPDMAKGQAKQFKHALSDALKRCAVHAGIGRYLYELSGVTANKIPKANLEKAMAAVGWHGTVEDKHCCIIGGVRQGDYEDDDTGEAAPAPPVAPPAAPKANSNRPRMKISEEQQAQIKSFVPNPGAQFFGWLKGNTANHADSLEDVLAEDFDELLLKLEALAKRPKEAAE
jgi:hypothetical protein